MRLQGFGAMKKNPPQHTAETVDSYEMLVAGLEPARCCHRGILSPLRLPIPPHQRTPEYLPPAARGQTLLQEESSTTASEWMGVDSNHRSNLQQIYSLSPLATREPIRENQIKF